MKPFITVVLTLLFLGNIIWAVENHPEATFILFILTGLAILILRYALSVNQSPNR